MEMRKIDVLNNLKGHALWPQSYHLSEAEAEVCIKALEQEPCEDAISRDMALEKMADYVASGYTDSVEDFEEYSRIICQLPSVNPQPKTGHWIYDRTRDWNGECKYECSECGMGSDVDYAYCMRCGAKMVEPQKSEDKE